MTTFRFQPSARLQRFLGKELIADPNLAIIEFVKNAYDAGAIKVFINFRITEFPTRLSIEDNGAGMDLASFERNWMHPGYSEKAPDAPPGHRISATTTGGRVPVGEKGLGRLAAGRLGNRLEVFTRRRASDRWLHVDFQWDRFDDMTKRMDEVQIPYDYESIPDDPSVHTGTIVVISGLQQIWDGKVRGRPAAGRSRTKLGRLKQDLRLLMRPFAANAREFVIYIDSDSFLDESDIGIVSAESVAEDADYVYSFGFKRKSRGNVTISRQLQRSERIIEELGGPKLERLPTVRLNDVAHLESRPDSLDCGPFHLYATTCGEARQGD